MSILGFILKNTTSWSVFILLAAILPFVFGMKVLHVVYKSVPSKHDLDNFMMQWKESVNRLEVATNKNTESIDELKEAVSHVKQETAFLKGVLQK